jgi:hypothetical protein
MVFFGFFCRVLPVYLGVKVNKENLESLDLLGNLEKLDVKDLG